MNIEQNKAILELLPLGFAYYSGDGSLVFANKRAKKISNQLFPRKLESLNISSRYMRKLKTGKTTLVDDSVYFHLYIKPLSKLKNGCVIIAQDTSDKESYVYLATHDSMTSLYNRAFFEAEFERLKNGRSFPVSIIFIDIDKLKKINDTLGHSVGDSAIARVGSIIEASVRRYDVVARIGGDEFVILLPNADAGVAERVTNRLKRGIADHNEKSNMQLSISIGCGIAKNAKAMRLKLLEADRKMYLQKKKTALVETIDPDADTKDPL